MGYMPLYYIEKHAIMLAKPKWTATMQPHNALCQQAELDLQ